jgi:hypothetical protein
MNKLKILPNTFAWNDAEQIWDAQSQRAVNSHPLKIPKKMPDMIPFTAETKKNLKFKALKWIVSKDKEGKIRSQFLKKPFKYGFNLIRSLSKKQAHSRRDEDFFLYGINSLNDFKELLKKPTTLLVIGFSFCHKPHECPSGRFSTNCMADSNNPICQQCFIGKCNNFLPTQNTITLSITTVHYIGEKIFEIVHANPDKEVIFIISACELTLTMFGDLGNMVGIKGIGIRLAGRICNTMQAFCLAENGIKPGLTIIENETEKRIFELIKVRYLSI